MSAIIGQRVFTAGGNQLYLSLLKDEYIRQLSISNNWTKIGIGLLYSIGSNFDILGFDWRIGMCSYGTPPQGIYAWSTTNWIGTFIPGNGVGVFTYTAGAGAPYIAVTSGGVQTNLNIRRTGLTTTLGSAFSTTINLPTNNGATSLRRGILILQIAKGTSNYTITGSGSLSVAQAQTDFTFEQLQEATQQVTQPAIVGQTTLTALPASGQVIACSETPGILDAISIAWKHSVVPLEIYGIAVYRYY